MEQKTKIKSNHRAKIAIVVGVIGIIIGATLDSSIQMFPIASGAVSVMAGMFSLFKK